MSASKDTCSELTPWDVDAKKYTTGLPGHGILQASCPDFDDGHDLIKRRRKDLFKRITHTDNGQTVHFVGVSRGWCLRSLRIFSRSSRIRTLQQRSE